MQWFVVGPITFCHCYAVLGVLSPLCGVETAVFLHLYQIVHIIKHYIIMYVSSPAGSGAEPRPKSPPRNHAYRSAPF